MKAVALILGVLLLLGGGAVAGAQFVSVDLSFLDSVAGAKEFLASSTALYAGAGAAGLGFVLFIVGLIPGKRREEPRRASAPPPRAEPRYEPQPEPRPEPRQEMRRPQAVPTPAPEPRREAPRAEASRAEAPRPVPAAPKPVASSAPPGGLRPAGAQSSTTETATWMNDPRLTNRKRVSDLVAINDAIKSYHSKHGRYPTADKLAGFLERGKAWIPGLAPEFIPDLPRDPAQANDRTGPQYLYASNGSDYKLLATGVSLVGGTNVEVLGVRFDPARQNTAESASFGFWTQGYANLNA